MRRSLKTFNNLENSLTRIPLSFKSRLIELIVHECQKICKLTCGILQNLPANVVCVLNHTPTSQPLFPPYPQSTRVVRKESFMQSLRRRDTSLSILSKGENTPAANVVHFFVGGEDKFNFMTLSGKEVAESGSWEFKNIAQINNWRSQGMLSVPMIVVN